MTSFNAMIIATIALVMTFTLNLGSAEAKGCIKGAIVGGAAGHVAGHHGFIGAAVGCAIGHHEANKDKKSDHTDQPQ